MLGSQFSTLREKLIVYVTELVPAVTGIEIAYVLASRANVAKIRIFARLVFTVTMLGRPEVV
jgi:hypothetical protein